LATSTSHKKPNRPRTQAIGPQHLENFRLSGLEARLTAHDRPAPDDLGDYDQLRDLEAGR
jgi:hypothetical protein